MCYGVYVGWILSFFRLFLWGELYCCVVVLCCYCVVSLGVCD